MVKYSIVCVTYPESILHLNQALEMVHCLFQALFHGCPTNTHQYRMATTLSYEYESTTVLHMIWGYPLGTGVLTFSPVTDVSILGVQASAGCVMVFIDWHSLQNSTHLAEIQLKNFKFLNFRSTWNTFGT